MVIPPFYLFNNPLTNVQQSPIFFVWGINPDGDIKMKKLLQSHQKTVQTISGLQVETIELFKYSTHYTIKAVRTGREYPEVRTGSAKHINKVWKEMTGKNGGL